MRLKYVEVAPLDGQPQDWIVYAVDDEGCIFSATFEGPDARARAEEYATFKYQTWKYGKDWNAT